MQNQHLSRSRSLFYETAADAEFQFFDGALRFSKALLAQRSVVFYNMFFSAENASERAFVIGDCGQDTFKKFLDFVMQFEDASIDDMSDAFNIFPLAVKFDVGNTIDRFLEILKPDMMNENVCHSLNLALATKSEQLKNNIINFLSTKNHLYAVMDSENYLFLLRG